jgi:hypothetical protein
VRIWDTRQPTAAATLTLPERVYAMDAKGGAIVVGTAGKQLVVYNISNLGGEQYFIPVVVTAYFISSFFAHFPSF